MKITVLDEVAIQRRVFGGELQLPCTPDLIHKMKIRSQTELRNDIPDEYLSFLRETNGVTWNGVSFYGCEESPINGKEGGKIWGFVDTNLIYRDVERMKNYLVFGQSDMDIYVINLSTHKYQVLDKISLDEITSVSTFEELLAKAFESRL